MLYISLIAYNLLASNRIWAMYKPVISDQLGYHMKSYQFNNGYVVEGKIGEQYIKV
jgi:hypothetical protein